MRIILNNLQNSRKTLSRLIRQYASAQYEGDLFYRESQKLKTTTYCIQTLLAYFKAEQDNEILERIERLEKIIEDKPTQ